MSYFGQPTERDDQGHPLQRWKVRKNPKCRYAPIWDVFEPDGTWSGSCETWTEAMEWATSIATRVEYWLEHQR